MSRAVRFGFTLVELLVVLGIMLTLMSLAVAIANSGIIDNHRVTAGADRVSGWLLQARAKAARDRLPRGVRFIPQANGFCTEAQFIEVPEPYVPNPNNIDTGLQLVLMYRQPSTPTGAMVQMRTFLASYHPSPTVAAQQIMNALNEFGFNDTISVPAYGILARINAAPVGMLLPGQPPPGVPAIELQVSTSRYPDVGNVTPQDTDVAVIRTAGVSFLRQARPMVGEASLKLSANTILDFSTGMSSASPSSGGGYDVLFAPNGEIMNTSAGQVLLWLRREDLATIVPVVRGGGTPAGTELRTRYESAGEMALITVYTKTGAVATHPVALPVSDNVANNPYQYAKDGIASGL